jgi:hypothetical protein
MSGPASDSTENADLLAKIEAKRRLRMPAPPLCVHECRTWLFVTFVAVNLNSKTSQAFHPPSVIENPLWLPPVGTLAPSKGCLQEHRSSVCTENLPSLARS